MLRERSDVFDCFFHAQPNTMASGMLTAPLGVSFRILSRNLDVGAPSEQYPNGNQSYNLNTLLTVPLTTGGQFVTDTLFFEVRRVKRMLNVRHRSNRSSSCANVGAAFRAPRDRGE